LNNALAEHVILYKQHAPRIKDQFRILVHSRNPKIKTVQDPNRKENCPGNQEPPHCLSKTSEDVCEPRNKAGRSNE
jgi:hypothetical protein